MGAVRVGEDSGWHFRSVERYNTDTVTAFIEQFLRYYKGRKIHRMVDTPLAQNERCPVEPDAVIFFGSASQTSELYGAYLRNRGGYPTFNGSNQMTCAAVTVVPIKENRPNSVIPGNERKSLALPSNTDSICIIPGSFLDKVAENVTEFRVGGGNRYSAAWHHLDQKA